MNIDRETALRIALACRTLPDTDLPTLIDVLNDCLGSPLTLDLLSRITVTDLKTSLGSMDGEEDGEDTGIMGRTGLESIKLAVRILWGETDQDEDVPSPEAYQQGDMKDSIRIAVCSNSAENLDGHFGSCLRYLIYQVNKEGHKLIDVRSALEADFSDDRNQFRVDLIRDCDVLYVVSMGGPASAKVIRANIFPMKKIDGGEAKTHIGELVSMMQGHPPPWLAKVLGVNAKNRLKFYDGSEEKIA